MFDFGILGGRQDREPPDIPPKSSSSTSSTSTFSRRTATTTIAYQYYSAEPVKAKRFGQILTPAQEQELNYLNLAWPRSTFKNLLAETLPSLGPFIMDDRIFLNLDLMSKLPSFYGADGLGNGQADLYLRSAYRAIATRTKLSSSGFVIGMKLVQRYRRSINDRQKDGAKSSRGNFVEPISSVYQLNMVALMVACKYTEDCPYSNKMWAQFTGLGCDQLNRLEQSFLVTIGHEIFLSDAEWRAWLLCLSKLCGWVPEAHRQAWQWSSVPSIYPPLKSVHSDDKTSSPSGGSRFEQYLRRVQQAQDNRSEERRSKDPQRFYV